MRKLEEFAMKGEGNEGIESDMEDRFGKKEVGEIWEDMMEI